jgi:hypothetical protein
VHSGQIASRKSGQRPQSQSILTIDGILNGSVANAETEEQLIFKLANPIEEPILLAEPSTLSSIGTGAHTV